MNTRHAIITLAATSALAVAGAALAQNHPTPSAPPPASYPSQTLPTTSSSSMRMNSDMQSNNKDDVKLAAAVRRAIMKDSSLSTAAHNVKVMAANGTVTLRGSVKSDDEKSKVETAARSVDGVQQVENNLDVKP